MPDRSSKILACAVVIEELRSRLPACTECETLDFGLHRSPELLRAKLQETIDRSRDYATIIMAFGLCGMATVGLRSESSTLVVPKADDCIAIFLGSQKAYLEQQRQHPGSYFLSKGWIEGRIDDTPPATQEYMRLVAKYGEERAKRMQEIFQARQPMRHYRRMAFIDTAAESDLAKYKDAARERAASLNLRYEEVPGSTAFMDKIGSGDWDGDFVVVPPGRAVAFTDFWPNE
jgi:hypothetical protein